MFKETHKMSKLHQYLEALKELETEIPGSKVESFTPEKISRVAKMIQNAYKIGGPLGYMDLVEIFSTGEKGNWDVKQRHAHRSDASMFLTGYGRTDNILNKWFDKKDGKYWPKEHKKKEVASGTFKPWAGIQSLDAIRQRRWKKEAKEREAAKAEEAKKFMGSGI